MRGLLSPLEGLHPVGSLFSRSPPPVPCTPTGSLAPAHPCTPTGPLAPAHPCIPLRVSRALSLSLAFTGARDLDSLDLRYPNTCWLQTGQDYCQGVEMGVGGWESQTSPAPSSVEVTHFLSQSVLRVRSLAAVPLHLLLLWTVRPSQLC